MRALMLLALLLARSVSAMAMQVYEPLGHMAANVTTTPFGDASPADDELVCFDFIETVGITNATKWVVEITGGAGTAASMTLYSAGGASIIRSTGAQDWSTTGIKTVAGLSTFSTTFGTEYRACYCRDGTGGSLRSATSVTTTVVSGFHNALTTHMGTAANACTNGVAPSSTGALTAGSFNFPLWAFDT